MRLKTVCVLQVFLQCRNKKLKNQAKKYLNEVFAILKKIVFDTYKKFCKNLILGTSGSDFLYVLRKNELIKLCVFTENNKRKQDAKSKKLYASKKSD